MNVSVPEGELPEAVTAGDPVPSAEAEPEPAHDPAAPAPLNVPRVPTGDAGVDAGLGRLADADHLATDGHLEVYEDVHRGLRDALTALDVRPGAPAPGGRPAVAPPMRSFGAPGEPSGQPFPSPYDRRS